MIRSAYVRFATQSFRMSRQVPSLGSEETPESIRSGLVYKGPAMRGQRHGLCRIYIGVMLRGVYRDNGKEHGNY